MSKMLLTTTSPFQKKLLQTAKGRRRPLCKALHRGEVGAQRRVRGRFSNDKPYPSPDLLRKSTSPYGLRHAHISKTDSGTVT